jgi:glyoxylase-like metal-dependent hydrolase (beta-lactamase superfamily II)
MRAECQFAKAGQGLFYNGILVDNSGKSFSFVYDCGTSSLPSVLNKSIDEFKNLVGKRIDILFVSHFHQDHVSHIPTLIKAIKLGKVVIPYVSIEARLLLAAQIESIVGDSEFKELFVDPAGYFISRGAESVDSIHYAENNEFPFYDDNDSENERNFLVMKVLLTI